MADQIGRGGPKAPASEPRKDNERDMRKAIVEDADKTEGKTAISCTAMEARSGSEKTGI